MVYSSVDVGGAERDVVRERSSTARHIETRGAHSHTDRLKPEEMVEFDSESPWTAQLETREIGIGGTPECCPARPPSMLASHQHMPLRMYTQVLLHAPAPM